MQSAPGATPGSARQSPLRIQGRRDLRTLCLAVPLAALLCTAQAQQGQPGLQAVAPPATEPARPQQIVASGTVPDEATKAAVLARLREVYGSERVRDQIAVGSVIAPANWTGHVQRLIDPSLKQITRGQLQIDGNRVALQGEVSSDASRAQLARDAQARLNPTYTIDNALRVAVDDQAVLDQTLANRIIEFAPASAQLLPAGQAILDEMAAVLAKLPGRRVEVIGHTDALGARDANVALSLARADAVKSHLQARGLSPEVIGISGAGPDRPIASNATEDGRARNRRIEFRVSSR